jgi:hypothetical protein
VEYQAGEYPWHASIGDLDGDGAPELVVAGWRDVVTILRGAGDAGFASVEEYSIYPDMNATALGDMNGDGAPDVVALADAALCVARTSSAYSPVEWTLYAVASPDGVVTVRWTVGSLSGITGFNVYRATSAIGVGSPETGFVRLNGEPLEATTPSSYDDHGTWPGAMFWYDVRAVLAGGGEESLAGSPACAIIPGVAALSLRIRGPNPFAETTQLQCDIPPDASEVRLSVYNCRGALVRGLLSGAATSGRHVVAWDARSEDGHELASGVYFVRLEADGQSITGKVVLLR